MGEVNKWQNSPEMQRFEAIDAEQQKDKDIFLSYAEIMAAPAPKVLIYWHECPIIWADGLNVIIAPVKTGKTSFLGLLLFGDDVQRRVLWVDGEQNVTDIQQTYKRLQAYKQTASEIEGLRMVQLVKRRREERLAVVAEAARRMLPDIIVIDGLAQLMAGKDEETLAADTVDALTALADEIGATVIATIQTARTSQENAIKGHLGSLAQERCVMAARLDKDADTGAVTFTQYACRRGADVQPLLLDRDSYGLLHFREPSTLSVAPPLKVDKGLLQAFRDAAEAGGGTFQKKELQKLLGNSDKQVRDILSDYHDTQYQPDASRPLRMYGSGRTTYYRLKDEFLDMTSQ